MRLPSLPANPGAPFPSADTALLDPNGLLAMGGDLSPARLLNAYRHGIFPWFSRGQPILWWSPDPRMVFGTDSVHLSARFRRSLRHSDWVATADSAFNAVIDACAHSPRSGQDGTWITGGMQAAYRELHDLGYAHSVEVHDHERCLVGGVYGVGIGRMFYGESMFSLRSGGSKVALAALAQRLHDWGWPLIDAQIDNLHLARMGAESWPRDRFLREIATLADKDGSVGSWAERFGNLPASTLADRSSD